jgi:hypothetical protein
MRTFFDPDGVLQFEIGGYAYSGGLVKVGVPVVVVTLCVTDNYLFDGSAATFVTDPRVLSWLEDMDENGYISEYKLTDVPIDIASQIIESDPAGAFYAIVE